MPASTLTACADRELPARMIARARGAAFRLFFIVLSSRTRGSQRGLAAGLPLCDSGVTKAGRAVLSQTCHKAVAGTHGPSSYPLLELERRAKECPDQLDSLPVYWCCWRW